MTDGNQTDCPKPEVNDQYWFRWSKTLVDAAIGQCDLAAERLQKLAVWLWGIYTASAAVGFGLSGKALSASTTALIAAASAGIIGVYWAAMWIQCPKPVRFDPREPADIDAAYQRIIRSKHRRLSFTLILAGVAAATVVLALIVASLPQTEVGSEIPAFTASISEASGQPMLLVTATLPDAEEVVVSAVLPESPGEPVAGTPFGLTPSGLLQVALPLQTDTSVVSAQLEWEASDGTLVRLSRRIEAESAE